METQKPWVFLAALCIFPCFQLVHAESVPSYRCSEVEGAKIIGEDGTYLGTLGDSQQSESIFNPYSDHGSSYSQESIWNEYSNYGTEYSQESPFNEYASDSPVLLKNGEVVGRLTVRSYGSDNINPRTIGTDCGWTE